jgi:hypothetical protein
MIELHPLPNVSYDCPYDNTRLVVIGWYIPGMRNLSDLRCPECGKEFYGEMPAGHGLRYPVLLDKHTGVAYDLKSVKWFVDWLQNSYVRRNDRPLEFVAEEFRSLHNPLLLNCLDTLYGHCLLKLLNAQSYLDKRPDLDLVVLVPKFLRWMVPEGVAAIWTVDLPLRRGTEWNDWLAAELHGRLESFAHCQLSSAYSHPHPKDFAIERFTRVRPFPVAEWSERLQTPTVTFIWRGDRLWGEAGTPGSLSSLFSKLSARLGLGGFPVQQREQTQRVSQLAMRLREAFPKLDFAIVGVGMPGDMPDWIKDLRTTAINTRVEKAWCDRYALSHVVIGVHGSNLLLPSAHAGATVELVPPDRWENIIQDLLMPDLDCREALFRYRIVPISVSAQEMTLLISSLLINHDRMQKNFSR